MTPIVVSEDLSAMKCWPLGGCAPGRLQRQVSQEVGFKTSNVLSIIKSGQSKLSLDRVPALARSLGMELDDLMLPALRQYFSDEVIDSLRATFGDANTQLERDLLALARKHAGAAKSLSFETRQRITEALKENKPAGQ